MRILIVVCIIFTSFLSTAVLSACSRATIETSNAPSVTDAVPSSTSIKPSTSSAKPSTATVGWATISSTPITPIIPTTEADPFRITTSSYQIKEIEELWWTFDYSFKVQNNTEHSLSINLVVQFLDSDNFDIATEYLQDVILEPLELKTITGVMKVEASLAWDMTTVMVSFN